MCEMKTDVADAGALRPEGVRRSEKLIKEDFNWIY
jgi:hypothetical protein